jgi:N-carbamoylputrescine amidase
MAERRVTLGGVGVGVMVVAAGELDDAERLVRAAAGEGANIVLLQELFHGPYFCKDERPEFLGWARPFAGHPLVARFADLAKELGVVIPVSFFERAGQAHFNSVALADADGAVLGLYRKSHIPQGPGYEEKYYFTPGDTGFKAFDTAFGRIGVGICWDQWFPECARAMALMGAEMLLYPTAIGSEPPDPAYDSQPHWERVMCGHAGANMMPLAAANRIGTEHAPAGRDVTFYGSSFIADATGGVVARAPRDAEAVLLASFDMEKAREFRRAWGVFRDRRPELYGALKGFG